jgi:FkbH-like protein
MHAQHAGNQETSAVSYHIPFVPDSLGAPLEGLKLLVLGTCQVEPLIKAAPACGHRADHMLFESLRHSPIPRVDLTQTDAAVVSFTLRHILADATNTPMGTADVLLARLHTAEKANALLAQCVTFIHEKVSSLHTGLNRVPTFFLSFQEPSFNYAGDLLDKYSPTGSRRFVSQLNEKLAGLLTGFPNFYLLDCNEMLNFVGRMHIQDDVSAASSHTSFISDWDHAVDRERVAPSRPNSHVFDFTTETLRYGECLWRAIANNLKILRQINPVKLIVVDLDDTLWRGIAAEDNLPAWQRTEGWPLGFVEALLFFKSRGGLLAICSKNDEEPTLRRFAEIWRDVITIEDFVSVKIGWQPKSQSMSEILAETKLLASNTLFIDDNPREIDEVKAVHLELRCLCENHYDWRRIILRSPETQVPTITAESAARTSLVRAVKVRDAQSELMSREEWLQSLDLEQSVFLVRDTSSKHFVRAMELINKTNQFNTTGKRWTLAELGDFFRRDGICLVSSLKDKTADNGIIGASLVQNGTVVQTVLSCRVFNLGAETVLGRFATVMALRQREVAMGVIVDTGKNFACHRYFENIGFQKSGEQYVARVPCAAPSWIRVIAAEIG